MTWKEIQEVIEGKREIVINIVPVEDIPVIAKTAVDPDDKANVDFDWVGFRALNRGYKAYPRNNHNTRKDKKSSYKPWQH